MKLNEMFPSNLLKAQDVTDAGGEMPLTIESVELKEFDGDNGAKERKPIIHFKEGKQMVCNKTNGNAIAELYGDDTDGWLGKELILVVRDVDFQGKSTPAIRVKNLSSKDVQIQAFWSKVRELNYSRDEGLATLKEHGGDFVKATAALTF